MKPHTRAEKDGAMNNLPKPVLDFLGSPALSKIYEGMGKKLGLNFRQMMVMSEITNSTLMGLESESALETNLHQWLHELSNEKTRELVVDINDRIFREARRRVGENIMNPEPKKSEERLGLTEGEIDTIIKEKVELVLTLAKKEKPQPPLQSIVKNTSEALPKNVGAPHATLPVVQPSPQVKETLPPPSAIGNADTTKPI